eukprot:5443741-Prymnesium_polylepis.1
MRRHHRNRRRNRHRNRRRVAPSACADLVRREESRSRAPRRQLTPARPSPRKERFFPATRTTLPIPVQTLKRPIHAPGCDYSTAATRVQTFVSNPIITHDSVSLYAASHRDLARLCPNQSEPECSPLSHTQPIGGA